MEEKIVELLQEKKIDAAIKLYAHAFNVTWSEAKSVIETYQSELSLSSPNHRSDSAFSMDEVNMFNFQSYCGDSDLTIEYLQKKYGLQKAEIELVLDEMSNGNISLPSYDLNTKEIMQLLGDKRKIAAITRYKELYDVTLTEAKRMVEKIELLLN